MVKRNVKCQLLENVRVNDLILAGTKMFEAVHTRFG